MHSKEIFRQILTSESSPSFRLLAKPCIDIAIELCDIRSMTHTFSDEGVRVWMKDEGMIKMKQSLEQWGKKKILLLRTHRLVISIQFRSQFDEQK